MAFNVNFWTFSKKERSTAQPTGQGTVYSCTANEPLDLLAPVISLKIALNTANPPTVYNYARIANFGRYYWVTGWEIRDGLWRASLRVDVLASHKTAIGNNSCYVYRSSHEQNNYVTDSRYPMTSQLNKFNYALSKIWTVGGSNAAGTADGVGTYVLGILSAGWSGLPGVQYYGFTASNLSFFMDYIFSDDYFDSILTEFGALEYPEAKVAINPLQYVVSARYYPIGMSTTGSGSYLLHAGGSTFVPIGQQVITRDSVWAGAFFDVPGSQQHFRITTQTWTMTPASSWEHPQSAVRGAWLNRPPFTRTELFFPPYGLIDLDTAAVMSATTLTIELSIDVWTGTGTLTVKTTTSGETRIISRISTQVGLDIPLSNSYYNGVKEQNIWNASWKAIGSALTGNLAGVREGYVDAYKTVVDSEIPHFCTFGTQNGSVAPMSGTPSLMITHQLLTDDDNAGQGRPLCAVRQFSNIPGFIMADADELSINCTDPELSDIRQAVTSGFYYE